MSTQFIAANDLAAEQCAYRLGHDAGSFTVDGLPVPAAPDDLKPAPLRIRSRPHAVPSGSRAIDKAIEDVEDLERRAPCRDCP